MSTAIRLTGFSGEQPHIIPRLLPPMAASETLNARLDDGGLSPYGSPEALETLEDGPFDTIYRFGEEWLAFEGTVHLAPGPVDADRLYYTGDDAPKMRVGSDVFPLAVPRPTTAPTAVLSGAGTGDVFTRSYVYTFVTSFGEESEPCAASNEVDWQAGKTVTLSGVENAPVSPDRDITLQRFYRTQSGSVGTDFYFVAERAVSNSNFVDNIAVDDFAEPLPSRHWNAPPDTLAGLISLPNGMMAAFSGRKLYFCEPYHPHAWPEIYVITTDHPIVALASAGTTVWVLTEGFPYAVNGSAPEAMVAAKVEANLSCINARGVVDLGYAIAYPSNEGIVVARADGSISLATQNLFSPRDWRLLNPASMNANQVSGRWIGSYTAASDVSGSLIIDLIGNASFLIRSSVKARAWFYDLATCELFFLDGSTIYQFDPPNAVPQSLFWRSKPYILSRPDNLGVILVEAGDVPSEAEIAAREAEIEAIVAVRAAAIAAGPVGGSLADATFCGTTMAGDLLPSVPAPLSFEAAVSVYADGRLRAVINDVDVVKRLPDGFKAKTWEIAVSANAQIGQITLARTVKELQQVPSG